MKLEIHLGEGQDRISWLKFSELDAKSLHKSSSVLVVVGAITSGRSLLAISRKLRCIHHLSTIVYFVGFSKLPNVEAQEQLRKDLCQGGHELVVLNECAVPRIKEYSKTAWDWELEILRPYSDDDPLGESIQLPKTLEERLKQLITGSGDSDQLFFLMVKEIY